MCRSREQAEAALKRLRGLLADLGREPEEAKTRIVHLRVGGEGFTFPGFHHQMVRSPARPGKRQVTLLARWPAGKAMQHARDRLRELTDRSRLRAPVKWVVQEMNLFLKGRAAYFRYGHSARCFPQLQWYAGMRLGLLVAKRHRRGRGFGRRVAGVASPDRLGLVSLDGTVVPPGRTGPGGGCRMPAVNGAGEPCAGEPHARFEAAGAGNRAPGHGHRSEAARRGNPGKSGCGT
jgi:RNA-directed DNA polymerase